MTTPHEWLFHRTRAGAPRDPARSRALLDALGAPDKAFDTIRVVGTNGKGSTCAMLEAGLLAAGERVGRFTSPHLERFEERIRVNGQEISAEDTAVFVQWARQHAPGEPFFDLALALAVSTFARFGVTTAVVEAGVGGQSDATHALGHVRAVLLTNVALDHTATLGPTIAAIARDKAGAARPGVPLLTTATGEALAVIREVAALRGAPLLTPQSHPQLFFLPAPPRLRGAHQADNARLALATLRLLGFEAGEKVALSATHPGRLERFEVQGREVWLDGAHNPHAARALAAAVGSVHTLLFGAFGRKAVADMLTELSPLARERVFTCPGEGAASPAELAAAYAGHAENDPRQALKRAVRLTPRGERLLVTGSLYLVGTIRTFLIGGQALFHDQP
ncbi:bifunctional folylpolyglutamate synthase/dihydrofolate synthase [Deinococcus peraridilitoris]|uniref:tetrahydrofolate synthase n=1 Tax=Deinococcus peraridilitoris (strain DSM 19664 / LMG 22246 / CIP 109416 / KR-200) TaxID=937777 RepID=L0A0E0_DEIPD|nr:cyanophycin synthetase [Deinococcus peraridilitoris]AFZ67358.1 folylpolyglutamate synthase/dihydrofolate synthase [Deinococcus peraridilitoris DSM 19664]